MTYVAKPKLHHPTLARNKIGFTRRDYEGKVSTLETKMNYAVGFALIILAVFVVFHEW